ncbi:malectin/receptor-like protein kinase family protein [Actinidia rufa]|uniref:Malectin/receptor-like protein kinase family protein n=1 Tax=Actinidia rufa TaxID=165716 RepID=A0A7J0E7X1_9ERIC|nr:malectin/receptor-like protein kinase family protein [Actinidia rufa]
MAMKLIVGVLLQTAMLYLDNGNMMDSGVIQSEESCRQFSLAEIQTATNDFDDALAIGIGGFGKVYKGFINNGTITVAIKRLKAESNQGEKEFWTEVKMLSRLRHAHLVALIGYPPDSYIHRDVKTTNIFAKRELGGKSFGFWIVQGNYERFNKPRNHRGQRHVGVFGSRLFFTHRLTQKSDVYAFGVVLLEVLCGRPPVDKNLKEEQISLILWAQQCIKKGKLHKLMDPSLSAQIAPRSLKYFVELAGRCLHQHPKARPSMTRVIGSLELVLASQQKGRTEGILAKVFQGIGFLAKGTSKDTSQVLQGIILDSKRVPKAINSISQSRTMKDLSQESCSRTSKDTRSQVSQGIVLVEDSSILGSRNMYRGFANMDGRTLVVAIKRFKDVTLQEWNELQPEIMVQCLFRHPNLVSLIGFLYEEHELILVYDYMPNGSLRDLLKTTILLMWGKRLEICISAAEGLQYLHTSKVYPNIKLSKIFLDEKLAAKVRDIKFPKRIPTSSSSTCINVSSVPSYCDKWGDLDPKDDLVCGKHREKHDMYSFGVMLLQVLISKESLNRFLKVIPGYRELPLLDLLKNILQLEAINYVIEPYLIGQIAPESLEEYVKITLRCLSEQGIHRPSMDYVVESLQSSLQLQRMWQTHNHVVAHYVPDYPLQKYFKEVGELVSSHASTYCGVEGRWGYFFVEEEYCFKPRMLSFT